MDDKERMEDDFKKRNDLRVDEKKEVNIKKSIGIKKKKKNCIKNDLKQKGLKKFFKVTKKI